jgi:outer membrane protein TolC
MLALVRRSWMRILGWRRTETPQGSRTLRPCSGNGRAALQADPILRQGELKFGRHTVVIAFLLCSSCAYGQTAPSSPDHPWHAPAERKVEDETKGIRNSGFSVDSAKTYSLAELVDLAESHNPDTRLAWERARSQAAALGIARSELYPTLVAVALSQTTRDEILFGNAFIRQTVQDFAVAVELNYTVFDFGGRSGRINAAKAESLASNLAFNDVHRKIIYQVQRAYYGLLNASGQEDAAQANLANAKTVQQAAEERLNNGLATLPDVLEARSATAEAEYELQAVLGAEEVARGDLATSLGTSPSTTIHVQELKDLAIPDSIGDNVEAAIDRALAQRPDLMQQVAAIRAANARIKEARSAFYPSLNMTARPTGESLFGLQQNLAWAQTSDLTGGVILNLNWTLFDGGARKNNLVRAQADEQAAQAQASSTRDQIANEVWAAYSNLNTAFRQHQSAQALLEASSKSYEAALESYNYGLRNLLDVTAAQRTFAQARSADVLARTQVLNALVDLAFRTGDSVQPRPTVP